ncbi:GNAT family N-acetyltransferase [Rossellomorea aquimaris]|uniref:GNAT family N-acetyltransferase n=1 Tax=Rossellomorea aquimaris TaxID=189382 RepID=UPI001CD5FF99|nr:GNAT family N-acetyltransferase [Rossellomorea aquimaris]MCA1053753.1 GNAT family N-acetyltransferase [Rossellomorea aquimaris]
MITPLVTSRLMLRTFEHSDAPAIQKLANNREVAEIIGLPQPYLLEHALEWIEIQPGLIQNGTEYPLAVVLKETDELVGTITLRVDRLNQSGELGYWVGRPYWGMGFATEAVECMISFGIEDLHLNKIRASALSKNKGSIAVLKKAGFTQEGLLKEERLVSGMFENLEIYGLLKK